MNADLMQRPAIGWIVIVEEEEDDWSGVYDCGAIFKPDRARLSGWRSRRLAARTMQLNN